MGGLAAHRCGGGSGSGVDNGIVVGVAATNDGPLLWVCPTGWRNVHTDYRRALAVSGGAWL